MALPIAPSSNREPRPVTGLAVLVWLVSFFLVVFAVNGVMVHFALSTLGGVETQSSYKAGLMFESEIHTAEQQQERRWQVAEHVAREADGSVVLTLQPRDQNGEPLRGLQAAAQLHHPVDARKDRALDLVETRPGSYEGRTQAEPGLWDVVVDLSKGDERLFRSKNRAEIW